MAKEVYRSFEGKLGVDKQYGYIITESKNFYDIEFLNVFNEMNDSYARIKKEFLSEDDFSDQEKIASLISDIEHGCLDAGQAYYKGKWYSYDLICKIQKDHRDNNWKKYVK